MVLTSMRKATMIVRRGTPSDVPQIIALMKRGLGEDVPRSEEYWRWKHIDNPFGPSEVLVAEQDDHLIGLRAFMRWDWTSGKKTFRALRAVDTVVDPAYRGKGIFKKLTLALRDECHIRGYDFIFNTPNSQSRPGYLKMGWQSAGRLAVRVKPVLPLFATNSESPVSLEVERAVAQYSPGPESVGARWTTVKNSEYLQWRYTHCPVVQYFGYTHPQQGWLVVAHPKQTSRGVELRIVDLLEGARQPGRKELAGALKMFIRAFRPQYVSVSPNLTAGIRRLLPLLGFLPACTIGPRLTYYPLSARAPVKVKASDFYYALGDMELF